MMVKCLVPGCPSKYDHLKSYRTMTFFRIPNILKNPKKLHLAMQWLNFCGLSVAAFPFGAQLKTICEKHFRPEDLEEIEQKVFRYGDRGYRQKRVKAGAVPTIFDINNPTVAHPAYHTRPCDEPPSSLVQEQTEGYKQEFAADEPLKDDDSRYVNNFIPEPLDKPLTEERKEAAELTRWPPDLKIPVSDLNPVLTCGICKGYFHNATTITVCLHTFCKGCVVTHFHESLNCPTCNIMVHPSDPFVNIKSDAILQDLVYKIFPQRLQHDKKDETDFYTSRGLNPPEQKIEKFTLSQSQDKKVRMISVRLDYAGTTPSLPPHKPLQKNFIRIPNTVTIGMIVKFLHIKMHLTVGSQAALFINCFMLNESLTVSRLEEIFGEQINERYGDMIFLQYGVVPKADYFDKGLLVSTKYL